MTVSIRTFALILAIGIVGFVALAMMSDELADKAIVFLLVGLLIFFLNLGFWGSWKDKQAKGTQRLESRIDSLAVGTKTEPHSPRSSSIPRVPLSIVLGVLLGIPSLFPILLLTTNEKIIFAVFLFLFPGLMLLIAIIAIGHSQRLRKEEMHRGAKTAGSLRPAMGQPLERLHVVTGPKVYGPSAPPWKLAGGLTVLGLSLIGAERYWLSSGGSGDDRGTIIGLALLTVALWVFGERRWVHLYEDRLEIRDSLSKGLQDRMGIVLCKPQVVYFREVKGLRHVRGFGGKLLQITRVSHPWQRMRISIPVSSVQSYADLETDILHRIPTATPVLLSSRT
jgi:4-amino-4-deoxy-L-arabinose transferase-like glycosyltransferase